jgi:hypothetical protein
MALSLKSLSRQGQQVAVGSAAGNPQAQQAGMLFYATDDAAATVEAAGYWNGARAFIRKGDVVIASMVNSGTPVSKSYVFTAVPATGNVTAAIQIDTAG